VRRARSAVDGARSSEKRETYSQVQDHGRLGSETCSEFGVASFRLLAPPANTNQFVLSCLKLQSRPWLVDALDELEGLRDLGRLLFTGLPERLTYTRH